MGLYPIPSQREDAAGHPVDQTADLLLLPSDFRLVRVGPDKAPLGGSYNDLAPEHRDHLLAELGAEGVALAHQLGARTIDAEEAHAMGFRFKGWRGGGLLLPFSGDFAQLRCDDPPRARNGDPVKYLNRLGVQQRPVLFGGSDSALATEGWKDALRLHLATGKPVAGLPGVSNTAQLPPTVELLIYDADAAINPAVWAPLIGAGLERPAMRLAFFPREVAGNKGGACEFFGKVGDLAEVRRWKARELLRELPWQWDRSMRADWQPQALRKLAQLAIAAAMSRDACNILVSTAAKGLGFPVARARQLLAAADQQAHPPEPDQVPDEPTKQELQQFLSTTHGLRFDELRQLVEIDGRPMEELDLADSFLAHLYGIETTKQAARDSFRYLATCNKFNPVREWLESLRSCPGLRLLPLQEIAAAFGIAADDNLSQELLARHLAGGYRRGIEPGYKHDQVLLMMGTQGQEKGQAIAALAPPGMADSATRVPNGLEDREFLGKLNSCWVFEFDEVEKVLQGRDAAEFKGFASRRAYRYVQKWETVCREHPARELLFATTNAREVLNDHTGNRRIWVVPVGRCNPSWVEQHRESIWATVATWVEWGLESYVPEGHPTARAAAERALGVQISDPWEGMVRTRLEAIPRPDAEGIALDDLASQALEIQEAERISRDVQMRLTRLVTGAGFTTHDGRFRWEQRKRRYGGGQPRSGYMPVPVPVFQPCSDDSWGGWNGRKPWHDRDLLTLFQPFQPFREWEEGKTGVCAPIGTCMCSSPPREKERHVETVGTHQQIPSAANDLPVPTLQKPVARGETPLEQGRAKVSRTSEHRQRVAAIPIGSPVEIRQPDRPPVNWHRMLGHLGRSERCQLTAPNGGTVEHPKAWVWPCDSEMQP
ncbi:hypothetical protein IQ216_00590 [Cyanobium sp. LEGE 06143]|uniref:VapE domain-containing protein n=1 Tax=Cyanobium sp. LEGE 06143 TaxID=945727 RepID=UPI0018830E83|nr:VapE domain-containing protein [Cyanobium sp. LEGE 06143]MBE9171640.1 hypothetical protein [Cyanobium sp. LEGE 06143]